MQILVAEDSTVSQRLLKRILDKWGYDITLVDNGNDAWLALQEPDAPSLAILDWIMPGLSGPEVCRKIRQNPQTSDTYAILLTAKEGKASIIEGLEAGADDYIAKPFNNDELRARIHVGERVLRLREELAGRVKQIEETYHQLEVLSSLDPLTGIANRRSFDTAISREFRRATRNGTPLSFFMLDIDFFKSYNDFYGHLTGDECLIKVANILKETMERGTDLVARYGGEEFAILGPEVGEGETCKLAEKIRKAVWDEQIEHQKSEISPYLTISIGCTCFMPDQSNSTGQKIKSKDLISQADKALYQAKNNGRNCFFM
jgi:diguanylate cyclase (GGDEF)-like protein